MKSLTNKELMNITGGGINAGILFGVAAGVTFLIGVIDGIIRPLKCN